MSGNQRQKQLLEELGTYPIMVSTIQTSKVFMVNNSDPDKEIIDYEMTAHVFGRALSLSCSNFALKRTAKDNEQQYDEEATQILERSLC